MEHSQQSEQQQSLASYCHWHPNVETRLYCSQCGKHVCIQCMVQVNVGIRCKVCGSAVRTPTYDVQNSYYARAISVAIATGIGGGVLWALFNFIFGGVPFLPSLAAVGIGYGIGELISLSVNRKRSTGLAWIAGSSVMGAFAISWGISPFVFGIFSLLLLGFGVYTAVQRVR